MWLVKAVFQLILSKIPLGEKINFKLQRQDGKNARAARHDRIPFLIQHIWRINSDKPIEGAVVVELGAGWDLINSIVFSILGAKRVYAFDHVAHARYAVIMQVVESLSSRIEDISQLTGIPEQTLESRISAMYNAQSLKEFLNQSRIVYHAPGNIDDLSIVDHSVDIVYTYAVLAHPPRKDLELMAIQSRRVLGKNGIASHYIGLHDPFSTLHNPTSNVAFLKHSERMWNFIVNNSINSNNRLRACEHIEIFKNVGGRVIFAEGTVSKLDIESLSSITVAKRFRGMTKEELATHRLVLTVRFEDSGKSVPLFFSYID